MVGAPGAVAGAGAQEWKGVRSRLLCPCGTPDLCFASSGRLTLHFSFRLHIVGGQVPRLPWHELRALVVPHGSPLPSCFRRTLDRLLSVKLDENRDDPTRLLPTKLSRHPDSGERKSLTTITPSTILCKFSRLAILLIANPNKPSLHPPVLGIRLLEVEVKAIGARSIMWLLLVLECDVRNDGIWRNVTTYLQSFCVQTTQPQKLDSKYVYMYTSSFSLVSLGLARSISTATR